MKCSKHVNTCTATKCNYFHFFISLDERMRLSTWISGLCICALFSMSEVGGEYTNRNIAILYPLPLLHLLYSILYDSIIFCKMYDNTSNFTI